MKYKLIAFSAIAVVLVAGFAASLREEPPEERYHQHLEVDKAAFAPCTHTADQFCTHLPILAIDSGGVIPVSESRKVTQESDYTTHLSDPVDCTVTLYDRQGQYNHPGDSPSDISMAQFRMRGNSSMLFDKPSYKLNLLHQDGSENHDIAFLGMPAHDQWALNGPILDKTLLRNYLSFNLAGQITPNTPEVRYFELFVNGEYRGVYLAMETVDRSEDRIPVTRYRDGDPFSSYIVRADRPLGLPSELDSFSNYSKKRHRRSRLEVIYPPAERLTPELRDYIEGDISTFEKMLYSFDYKDKTHGYRNFIGTNSFVDYFILNEFSKNADAGIFSTYLYKDVRGELQIGPVWDFNNAYDNYMEIAYTPEDFVMVGNVYFDMLTRDPDFVEAVISRYKQLRKGPLSEEYLLNYIDSTADWLGDSIDRNNAVWGYTYDTSQVNDDNRLHPDQRNPADYDEAVTQLKEFIVQRGHWLDANIEVLRQYAHPSKAKKFNH